MPIDGPGDADAPDRAAPPRAAPSAPGCLQSLGMIGVGLTVLLTAALGIVAGRYLMPTPPPVTTVVNAGPPVVVAIKSLARLETAQFHMERVIDLRDKQEYMMGLLDSEDAILLVAAARVSAGVDLSAIGDGDVDVDADRKRVTIRLPAPVLFEAALDNERTYVHTRSTDLLAERSDDLETKARQQAELRLKEAAVEAGLLRVAADNAERTVTSLLTSLGFEEVKVEVAR